MVAEMMGTLLYTMSNPGVVSQYMSYKFAGLWALVWHFGLGGAIVLGCIALYIFTPAFLSRIFPNIQRTLLWVAAIVVAIMVSTAIGVNLGEKRIQAQWDVAKSNSLKVGKKARVDGVRDAARTAARKLPAHRDPDLRD